jgi:hypothetical protein
MKSMFLRFKKKPTLFLIGGTGAILYSIPAIFYYIPRNGGESMYALLYFYLIAASLVVLVVDWGFTRLINFKVVSVVEAFLVLGIYLMINYNEKTATLDITAIKRPYLIIVDDPAGVDKSQFHSSGMFNKIYNVRDTDVVRINQASLNSYELNFKDPVSWNAGHTQIYFYKPEVVFDIAVILQSDSTIYIKYSNAVIDSLLKRKGFKTERAIK